MRMDRKVPTAGAGLVGIAPGPDGNVWFTEYSANNIGRITPTGAITEFPLPTPNSYPNWLTSGPDGNIWFSEASHIGRITSNGTITEYPLPAPRGLVTGADGNLWIVVEGAGAKIGRFVPPSN